MASENGHSPEAADYIGSLADELAKLAKSHNLDALAYILDMARLEADQISKRWVGETPPDAGTGRLGRSADRRRSSSPGGICVRCTTSSGRDRTGCKGR